MPSEVVARRITRRITVAVVAAVAAIGGALSLAAPSNKPAVNAGPITDHFALRATFFAPAVNTDARFDSNAGVLGTRFNAESDLGLDDKIDQGRMELIFRMRDRHRLRVDYFKLDRDGDKLLSRQIVFGNSTYNVNDRVLSSVSWRMTGFTYTWSALRAQNYELGIGVGLHLIAVEARGEVRTRNLRESGTGVGPMPTAAVDGSWQFGRRWSLNGRAQQFSVSVSNVKGSLSDYHLDAQYRWHPNMAVGVGWSMMKADVNITGSGSPGQFTLDTSGPELFFRASF